MRYEVKYKGQTVETVEFEILEDGTFANITKHNGESPLTEFWFDCENNANDTELVWNDAHAELRKAVDTDEDPYIHEYYDINEYYD